MKLKYDKDGLIPAVAQDAVTGQVLMLAYMNEEAVALTLEKGLTHYYSRSRGQLWLKGETSGNYQEVKGFYYDCDADAILLKVLQKGVACHQGSYSCFANKVQEDQKCGPLLPRLFAIINERKTNPMENSYTNYLFREGTDKMLKKLGEEAAEVIIAAKNNKQELIYESCDLFYHLIVLLASEGVTLADLQGELAQRME